MESGKKDMERIWPAERCWSKVLLLKLHDVSINKYSVKSGASLRFWENKGCINKIDPYGWFQWYFRYWKMMKDKLIEGKELWVDKLE